MASNNDAYYALAPDGDGSQLTNISTVQITGLGTAANHAAADFDAAGSAAGVGASLAAHAANTANPHATTAAQVGAATPAQVSAAVAGVTPATLGLTIGSAVQAHAPALDALSGPDLHSPAAALMPGVFNVRLYGAVGNGTTDDTPAWSSAYAAAAANGGGLVVVPPGNYFLDTTGAAGLVHPANTTTMGYPGASKVSFGSSAGAFAACFNVSNPGVTIQDLTITRAAAFDAVMVSVGVASDVEFRGVVFDGAAATYPTHYCHGIKYGNDDGTHIAVDDVSATFCTFKNLSYGIYGSNASGADLARWLVAFNRFRGNTSDDVCFNAPTTGGGGAAITDVLVGFNFFASNASNANTAGFAVDLANVQRSVVAGNLIDDYQYEGVHLEDSTAQAVVALNVLSKCAQADESVIQIIDNSSNVAVVGNVVDQSAVASVGSGRSSAACVYVQPGGSYPTPTNIALTGNVLRVGPAYNGVDCFGVPYLAASGNVVTGPGAVTSNVFAGAAGYGISPANGGPAAITCNVFAGLASVVPNTTSNFPALGKGILLANVVDACGVGLGQQPTGEVVVVANLISGCVDPLDLGSNGVTQTNAPALVALNLGVGNVNPLGTHADGFWSTANGAAGSPRFVWGNCQDYADAGHGGWPLYGTTFNPDPAITSPRFTVPTAAPDDSTLAGAQVSFYLDETGNNLKVRVKYDNGTLKTATVALA